MKIIIIAVINIAVPVIAETEIKFLRLDFIYKGLELFDIFLKAVAVDKLAGHSVYHRTGNGIVFNLFIVMLFKAFGSFGIIAFTATALGKSRFHIKNETSFIFSAVYMFKKELAGKYS